MAISVCEECGAAFRGEPERCPECEAPIGRHDEIRRLPSEVVVAFVEHAEDYLAATPGRQLALAFMAGSFICFGAMLSVVLTVGIGASGPAELVLGLGFTAGFALVILSGAALFTEVNVLLPSLFLSGPRPARLARFWVIVYMGNALGAIFVGAMLNFADVVGPDQAQRLSELIAVKTQFAHTGAEGWVRAVASGVLANWLVGMAAFLATAARTVGGKIIGIALPILAFVALGVQHAPANMGYFSIGLIHGDIGTNLGTALAWSIAPATFGNLIGGGIFVALLFGYTFGSTRDGRRSLERVEGLARAGR